MGSYGLTSNARYLYLKADKKLTIYNKLNKNDDKTKWTTKVDNNIHSKMYDLATKNGLLLGGSESVV